MNEFHAFFTVYVHNMLLNYYTNDECKVSPQRQELRKLHYATFWRFSDVRATGGNRTALSDGTSSFFRFEFWVSVCSSPSESSTVAMLHLERYTLLPAATYDAFGNFLKPLQVHRRL